MNNLEAAVLLTTSYEINTGRLQEFCKQFQNMKYCGLKFFIVVNNSNFDPGELMFLNQIKIFQSIQVYDIDIPPKEDIYIRNFEKAPSSTWPRLGLSSGPNILFFETIKLCSDLNTILILETDCILKKNCFEVCSKYISSMSDFLISGSKYIGRQATWNTNDTIFHHLNGVAFYRTGILELQSLLANVEQYIATKVTERVSYSYDVAIMGYVHYCINHNPSQRNYYKTVESKLIGNTFILNYSVDSDVNPCEVALYFPNYVILHSKLNI